MPINVLLKQDIRNLGRAGEHAKVKPGYARNYLFPKGLAIALGAKGEQHLKHLQFVADAKAKKAKTLRQSQAEKLSGQELHFKRAATKEGKLFGSVGVKDVLKALDALGFALDKKQLSITEPLKQAGEHELRVRWDKEAESVVRIVIEPEAATAAENTASVFDAPDPEPDPEAEEETEEKAVEPEETAQASER